MRNTHRSSLNNKQVKVLKLVAKFRFVNIEIISKVLNKSKSTIYERLTILEKLGYIQKRYEKKWKLLGKPAAYSLTGKGVRAVQDNSAMKLSDNVMRNQYKNKSASLALIDHNLDIATLCLQLRDHYTTAYDLFTKSQIDKFDQFLRPLSDIYIRTNRTNDEDLQVCYLLETIEAGTFTWIIRKRINAHQEWYDDESSIDWLFTNNYPTLLFVCDNTSTEKRIHKLTDNLSEDIEVWTVTRERFLTNEKKVWVQYWDEYINEGILLEL